MAYSIVSSKGQITIPAKFRSKFRIKAKDKVQIFSRGDEIIIRPVPLFRELRGSISKKIGNHRKKIMEAVSRHVID